MSTKTTIFFIFAICLLVNQVSSEMPTLKKCCAANLSDACKCISANYDPDYKQQCTKDEKTVKSYVKKACKKH
ncbi:unnamed protein product [Meloidogyne enterolobii]|uniref:Uncharacterized protein n=1 Tax=Meloidogyne enterolobii TaxID=390850 RepID=A0ACB1A903_MELEN